MNNKGLSFIELITSMAIVGILALGVMYIAKSQKSLFAGLNFNSNVVPKNLEARNIRNSSGVLEYVEGERLKTVHYNDDAINKKKMSCRLLNLDFVERTDAQGDTIYECHVKVHRCGNPFQLGYPCPSVSPSLGGVTPIKALCDLEMRSLVTKPSYCETL